MKPEDISSKSCLLSSLGGYMTEVHYGHKLGKEGELRLGCTAAIFDETREKVLLTRRADNGLWCLPGGLMNSGESVTETCIREVYEETGLEIQVTRLVGIYSNPDQLVVYPDGNKAFIVAIHFEADILEGIPRLSEKTTEVGFFSLDEIEFFSFLGHHKERIYDSLQDRKAAIIR
jgi:ADP-ribose pyrophosphatase YjhB (NUDIX family)